MRCIGDIHPSRSNLLLSSRSSPGLFWGCPRSRSQSKRVLLNKHPGMRAFNSFLSNFSRNFLKSLSLRSFIYICRWPYPEEYLKNAVIASWSHSLLRNKHWATAPSTVSRFQSSRFSQSKLPSTRIAGKHISCHSYSIILQCIMV